MIKSTFRFRRPVYLAALLAALVLLVLLGGCGTSPTQAVVVVTATPMPGPVVVIVTATPSPVAQVAASDTPAPPAGSPTVDPNDVLTAQAIMTQVAPPATDTPAPTETSLPTDTPKPEPTNTKAPPKPTATRKPAATKPPANYPPPVQLSPDAEFSCYNISGCYFSWSWGMTPAANQYFQVQLVGPGNEHRGIHPPTKQYSFQSNWSIYQIIRDWCDAGKMCHMQWVVAVIEWDGKDPSKIGRTLVESAKRWVWL